MRDVGQIEADLDKAREAARSADRVRVELERELQAALNESSGIIGHVLEFQKASGWGRNRTARTFRLMVETVRKGVDDNGAPAMVASGRLVVAGGEVGIRSERTFISKAKDLGTLEEARKLTRGTSHE